MNKAATREIKLDALIPDARNANKGTERGGGMVESSLRKYGAGRSILLDKHGRIIAGNKTAEHAGAIGLEDVIVVKSDGRKLVAVQRTDLDLETDAAAKELAIADNRAGELSLAWDGAVLAELGQEIDLEPFFSAEELASLVAPIIEGELLTDEDECPEPPAEPKAKRGDLYALGRHRLLCGDSTNAADVKKVLAGAAPLLMVTDPPYGVEYDANGRNEHVRSNGPPIGGRAVGKVSNDDRADWREAWALFPGEVAYVWHGAMHAPTVAESLAAADFEIRSQIIWAKSNFAISRGHYHWMHEPCWYAVRKGKTAHWAGDRKQTTLWQIDKPQKSETGHNTQKPVECMRRPIVNNSEPGDAVYDPFLGSGTTLIACETEGRRCHGIEIDPAYVDVIVQRWEAATGQTAELLGEGTA